MGNKVQKKDPVFFVQNDKIRPLGIWKRDDFYFRDDRTVSSLFGRVEGGIDRSGFIVPSLDMIHPDLPESGRREIDGRPQFDLPGGVERVREHLERLAPR